MLPRATTELKRASEPAGRPAADRIVSRTRIGIVDRAELNSALKHDMAQTDAIAERVIEALDRELRAQSERARAVGAMNTLPEAEADLARATERLSAIEEKIGELGQRARHAMERFDMAEVRATLSESEALHVEAEPIAAEIMELKALVAELRRVAG